MINITYDGMTQKHLIEFDIPDSQVGPKTAENLNKLLKEIPGDPPRDGKHEVTILQTDDRQRLLARLLLEISQ